MTKSSLSRWSVGPWTHLILGLAGTSWLSGCELGTQGNGERAEEVRDVAAFSKVRSDCELDIDIVQGDQQSLIVSLDSNLIDSIGTRVVGDTLYIEAFENMDDMIEGPHVQITVPVLSAAKLAGSGTMALAFDLPELPLDLYLSGSGDLRFDGRTAALGAFLNGSGDIRLQGETGDADLSLSGSGDIRARDLAATSADIDLSGSGDISATLDAARVALTGSGRIDLYGDPSVDVYDDSGSGDIVRH